MLGSAGHQQFPTKCIIYIVCASISPNSDLHEAWFEAPKFPKSALFALCLRQFPDSRLAKSMLWGPRKFPKVHYLPCVCVDFPKLRLAKSMFWGLRKFPKVHYLPCVRVDFPKLRLALSTAGGPEKRKQTVRVYVCMRVLRLSASFVR